MELLFDRDPLTRTVQVFHYNEANDHVTLEDKQDVTAILKAANRMRQLDRPKGDMRRAATIPLNILFELKKKWRDLGYSYEERQKALKAWVNDPDNACFRAEFQGRV